MYQNVHYKVGREPNSTINLLLILKIQMMPRLLLYCERHSRLATWPIKKKQSAFENGSGDENDRVWFSNDRTSARGWLVILTWLVWGCKIFYTAQEKWSFPLGKEFLKSDQRFRKLSSTTFVLSKEAISNL